MPVVKLVFEDRWQKFVELPFLPRAEDMVDIGRLSNGDVLTGEPDFTAFYVQSGVVAVHLFFSGSREEYEEVMRLADETFFTELDWEPFREERI